MGADIEKGVQPKIELNNEKLSFVTSDGELYSVTLKPLLEKGDTTQAMMFASLLLLSNSIEKQGELAVAMTDMANAVRSLATRTNANPEEAIKMIMGPVREMLQGAGMVTQVPPKKD